MMFGEELIDYIDEYPYLVDSLGILSVLVLTYIVFIVSKHYAPKLFKQLIEKTETHIDDIILERVILKRLIYIFPVLTINTLSFVFLGAEEVVKRISSAVIALIILMSIGALLDTITYIYSMGEKSKRIHIKSHMQLVKIFIYVVGFVTILSQLTGNSPWFFISGMGVFTAIILMIFRDTILSFVAGLQIASNDLFKEGDWLEVPAFGADGTVIDISLHTVRIQNWDKTITAIPTHKILAVSFKNWRGMTESGGRRIKRSINIDISSIRPCDDIMLARFRKINYLKDYLAGKEIEVEEWNREKNIDKHEIVNARHLTNVGTFRAYIVGYLENNPQIHRGLTFLVRQLPPGPTGLPIQIYVFTNDTNWVNYEAIQANIFDHLLAVMPEFGLRVFQNPTGKDFEKLRDESRQGGGVQSREAMGDRGCGGLTRKTGVE